MTPFMPADAAVRERIRTAVDENMCVEAGAGTGKTTVLVERVIEILRTGRATVREIVVITFTEKAAAELSARVRRGLEVARSGSSNAIEQRRLDAALLEFHAAHIETIHAFATSLLRERPVDAGLDPGFSVLEDLPRQLAFEATWDEWVTDEMAQDPPPPALVDALNVGLDWRWVREAAKRLNEHREVLPLAPYAEESVDIDELIAGMREVIGEFERDWERHCGNEENVTLRELRAMRNLQGQIIALHSRQEPAGPLIVEAETPDTFHGAKTDWRPNSARPKDLLIKLAKLLEEAKGRLKRAATARFIVWISGFVEFYASKRMKEGTADFDDLLIWARNLVRDNAEAREYFQSKYRCILVDEFQDTDPLQAELIIRLCAMEDAGENWRLSRLRPGSLFVVGDPKQSIYRFRRADITMYEDIKNRVFGGDAEIIAQNFRSAGSIIDFVNNTFGKLIAHEGGAQPAYIDLIPHPALAHGNVAIITGEAPKDHGARARDTRTAEAKAIASMIRQELAGGTWQVRDKHTGLLRPAEYRDVAVLIPTRTELQLYEEQLSLAGIPYHHEGGRTFFQRQEVRELIAILRALDDPGDEIAVIAALRSPAFACSDEELYLHRAQWRLDYATLSAEASGLVADSLRALRTLASRRFEKALPEFVRDVIDSLRLVEFAMLQHQGEQAASNVLKIIDQARAFTEARPASGLRAFVRWLKENVARASDETDASIVEESDNAVRIVTIHMAKGLEFGVVIFANMGTERADRTNVIVTHELIGGTLHVRLGPRDSGYCTPGYAAAEIIEHSHAHAEQLRLLYVAATRARDHLVVPFFHWEGDDPRRTMAERKCLNDHLRSVDVDETEGALDAATLPPITGDIDIVRVSSDQASAAAVRTIIEERESWQAARQTLLDIGSAGLRIHTATSLKQEWSLNDSQEPFVQRGRAREFGSAVHAVLERIDLDAPDEVSDLLTAVATEFGMLDRRGEMRMCVEHVLQHEVVQRAKSSPRVLREVAFTAPLPQAGDGGLAEGRIDLLFLNEQGSVVVVDFKTDRVDEATAPGRAAVYRSQALVYAWAASRTTGLPVGEVVFLFARGPQTYEYAVDSAFLAEAEELLRAAPVRV